jgi:hypothetical protein
MRVLKGKFTSSVFQSFKEKTPKTRKLVSGPQCVKCFRGAYDGAIGWGTALLAGRSWVRFPMVSLDFFIDIILPAALWPCG